MNSSRNLKKFNFVILVILAVVATQSYAVADQKGYLKIFFLDVGQGDAMFIETPDGSQILIDGGPDSKILTKLSEIMPFYDHSIDVVILSHPHSDHLTGLIEVLDRYEVANILQANENYDSPIFNAWNRKKEKENSNEIEAISGKTIKVGKDILLTVIYPLGSLNGKSTKDPNNDSVTVLLQYKNFKALFTGDIEKPVEEKLVILNADLKSDVLKVAHQGSKTSSTQEFLNAVLPQLAVIEVGENNQYGHPHKEVLDRLESFKIPYYRTDINGTIKVVSDGTTFAVSKEK